MIYRTIQRSENIQRSDLVICEFGELYYLNHHLKVCYLREGFRYLGVQFLSFLAT